MREIAIDSKTVLVPADAGGFVVCESDAARGPTKYKQSVDSYKTQADALRAVLAGAVRYGQWKPL